jgi:hypothetical protein
MSAIARIAGRSVLQVKKFSPEILTGFGIVGVVTSGVLTARATLKLEAVVDKLDKEKERVNDVAVNEEDHKRLMFAAHRTFVLDLAKLYGPSVSLGAVSITALLGAHGIMRKRNLAILGAYKTLESAYSEYRSRVVAELGEEKEREIRLGLRAFGDSSEDESEPLTKDGFLDGLTKSSPYSKVFDQFNDNWKTKQDYNRTFLMSQQNYANDLLKARGHLFLNEVYTMLGYDHTSDGALVGWVYDKDAPLGDNAVDFGVFGFNGNAYSSAFLEGEDNVVVLDFNVDGIIFDKI